MSHPRTVTEKLSAQEIAVVRACVDRRGETAAAHRLGVSVETLRKVYVGADGVGKQTAHSVRLLCELEGGDERTL